MPSATRIALHAAMRAGTMSLLESFATEVELKLQLYSARPASIFPPTAFVDAINEVTEWTGLYQRTVTVEVMVLHGVFDHKDTAVQRDAFVDAFVDWNFDNIHDADPNTTLGVVSIDDEPTYVPDWVPPANQRTYYGTRITLRGYAGTG